MFKPLQNSERFKWVLLALVFQCSIGTIESRALKSEDLDVSPNNYLSGDNAIIKGKSYAAAGDAANEFTFTPDSHIPENKKAAINGKVSLAQYFSLNGICKFNFIRKPADQPRNFYFYAADLDDTKWDTIIIVSSNCAEVCNHHIIYLDEKYPFDTKCLDAPQDYNQMSPYKGMQTSYSEDFKTPAEFDITKYSRAGPNRIALPGFSQSNGHYPAEQGMLKWPEIEHSIYLFSTTELYVFDYFSKRATDHLYKNGRLSLPVQIRNYRIEETLPDNSQHFKELFISAQKVKNSSQKIFQIPLNDTVSTRKWTTETPNFIPF